MRHLSDRRVTAMFALVLASGACCALLLYRRVALDTVEYRFLVWNLVLAWVPFLCALVLYDGQRRGWSRVMLIPIAGMWLLFLPNAPYITTDFIHVGEIGGAPVWFDALLVASFAGTGLLLGLGSLVLVQRVVTRATGVVMGWLFVLPVLALCSAGVVLGRVYRFNSWDALTRPEQIIDLLAARLAEPAKLALGLPLLAALSVALGVAYLVVYSLASLTADER